jgi:TPR repeat protein
MRTLLLRVALSALVLVSSPAFAASDHPELSAADQAYSTEKYELAAELYRRDAELGLVAAQVNLAIMYLDGIGVAQDYGQALRWFERAAEKGNKEAQQNLAVLYRDGLGVKQSDVRAASWFRIAGATRSAEDLEQRMTAADVAEAKQRAESWVREHGRSSRH